VGRIGQNAERLQNRVKKELTAGDDANVDGDAGEPGAPAKKKKRTDSENLKLVARRR